MKQRTRLLAGLLLAAHAAFAGADPIHAGDIMLSQAWARPSAPGQPNGGAYLRLENHGAADRLLGGRSDVAQRVELHTSRMEGDVMRMREVDWIELPAHKTVELKPDGMHVMLVGLKTPLKAGASFPLTLRFQKAGEVTLDVPVSAASPAKAHSHDMKH